MVEHILLCQHCGSERLVRNGRAPNGKQKFICHACGRRCRRNPLPRGYSEVERARILRAYQERCSLRGLQRTFGVAPANIAKWIKKPRVWHLWASRWSNRHGRAGSRRCWNSMKSGATSVGSLLPFVVERLRLALSPKGRVCLGRPYGNYGPPTLGMTPSQLSLGLRLH
jgi:hypothetical protein